MASPPASDPTSTSSPPGRRTPEPVQHNGDPNTASAMTPTRGTSTPNSPRPLRRSSTAASVVSNASSRIRAASIKLMDADPPVGMWAATGSHASKAPTLADIRRGSFDRSGWKDPHQQLSRGSSQGSLSRGAPAATTPNGVGPFPALTEEETNAAAATGVGAGSASGHATAVENHESAKASSEATEKTDTQLAAVEKSQTDGTEAESPAYEPPPPLPWTTATAIGLRSFWHWFLTIPGFLITIYGLNVVAWGGMLFLLLCNAAPAMCKPSCNDINSPRRVWIETDSQILNALFCVTGFGLAPWRFRDLYWWAWWRLGRKPETKLTGLRRLAGINKGWFRLAGSDKLGPHGSTDVNNPAVPIPLSKAPTSPLTGIRAPPTKQWKLDFVIWMNVWNTLFQACLSGFMWGMNRFERPSWSTGLFVALACIVAGVAGWVMFQEGKKVKRVEGAPISKEERKARGWPLEDEETGHATGASANTPETKGENKSDLKEKIKRAFG